jgi:hypothetical protein
MGATFDYMCDNERQSSLIAKKNKQIREQKKLIEELAQGIVDNFDGEYATPNDFKLHEIAEKVLAKNDKKKKK